MGGRDMGVMSMVLTLGWARGGFCGVSLLASSRSSSGLLFSAGVFLPPGFRYVCVCVALAHLVFYGRENKCVKREKM